ncbi:MAG TPA: tyrosine-type recombinase/integrase [Chitinophagaceae bacterium]|nr:tyrosine-type recombinase/integrase [Chitinophagaceae bacterium]
MYHVKARKRKLKDGRYSWYLDQHINRVRKPLWLGIFTVDPKTPMDRIKNKEAMELIQRIILERQRSFIQNNYGLEEKVKSNENFIDYFKNYISSHNLSDVRMFISVLNKLIAFKGSLKLYCFEINDAFLEKFKAYLDAHLNGSTPYNYLKKLKKVLKEATKDKLFRVIPGEHFVNTKKKSKEKDVLTLEEINILKETECPNNQVKLAFLFSCFTGVRYCDVNVLCWKNIKSDRIEIVQNKTGEKVEIPLNDKLRELVGNRKTDDCKVFRLPSHTSCLTSLRKWSEKAGIGKRPTYHSSRHSFGTNLIGSGTDVVTTSRLMGHTSLRYTNGYIRISEKFKQDAINRLTTTF